MVPVSILAFFSCNKGEETDGFGSGTCIAVAEVGASEGRLSVSVETEGTWRIDCDAEWISFDVQGGSGNQAFTVYFTSNVPDVIDLKQARVARIAISLDSYMVSDTLALVQRGFLGSGKSIDVHPDNRVALEFDSKAITEATFVCCSSAGLEDKEALTAWVESQQADAFVLDGVVYGALPGGISIAGCDYEGLSADDQYRAFRNLVNGTINASFEGGTAWILAGQMYHYSSMQSSYPSTPAWYPGDARGDDFRSDRFAWQNNLYDCIWMATQDYVTTYTDAEGHSYGADYVYVSSSVLGMISSLNLVDSPIPGMTHKAIVLKLKY